MILNLFTDATTPAAMRDQINASLSELSAAMDRVVIGEVISVEGQNSGQMYTHSLGVRPRMALYMGSGSVPKVVSGDERWTDTQVYLPYYSGAIRVLLVAPV